MGSPLLVGNIIQILVILFSTCNLLVEGYQYFSLMHGTRKNPLMKLHIKFFVSITGFDKENLNEETYQHYDIMDKH